MSTRSTTHFVEGARTEAIVYRHSDGYPEGAGADLLAFLDEVSALADSRFSDASYLAAKYVVFLSGIFTKYSKTDSPLDFLSVGVVSDDPGDIEYRYVVDCSQLENGRPLVRCFEVGWKMADPSQSGWLETPDKEIDLGAALANAQFGDPV